MNPIVNTQHDSTQSGMDSALSSTPHGSRSHPVAAFWKKPNLAHVALTTSRGCLWNTFVTIGSASAFVELWRPLPICSRLFGPASEGLTGSIPQSRVDFSKDACRARLQKCENRLAARKNDSVRESFLSDMHVCADQLRVVAQRPPGPALGSFGLIWNWLDICNIQASAEVACWLGKACHIAWLRAPSWL